MEEPFEIAIVGGGPAGLAAAFALTEKQDPKKVIRVTVYQAGWRLGGKCASGHDGRIEEHGLHVWAGFYHEAFALVEKVYDELGRDWRSAFLACRDVLLQDRDGLRWEPVGYRFPQGPQADPGDPDERPTLWNLYRRLAELLQRLGRDDEEFAKREIENEEDLRSAVTALQDSFGPAVPLPWQAFDAGAGTPRPTCTDVLTLLVQLAGLVKPEDAPATLAPQLLAISRLVDVLFPNLAALEAALHLLGRDRAGERRRDALRIALAIARGFVADLLPIHGLDSIDGEELQPWLRRHGATVRSLDAAFVRAGYDWAFAYHKGQRCIAAGVGLQGFLRLVLDYREAPFWRMQGSMGDTVILPLYRVLAARGVRFRFFHRLEDVALDQGRVRELRFHRQVRLRAADYDPIELRQRAGRDALEVWPARPRFEQVEHGDELERLCREGRIDLDSGAKTDTWTHAGGSFALRARTAAAAGDEVFDAVVLAIPPEAQKVGAPGLRADAHWKAMQDALGSARTAAMQLWFEDPIVNFAGGGASGGFSTAFVNPFSTWADMSHVLSFEDRQDPPRALVYLCGVLPDAIAGESALRTLVKAWLPAESPNFWTLPRGGFDWRMLFDPKGGKGAARLDAQFLRANVRPADSYVLSLPGTTALRIRPEASGIDNLFPAGDWVRAELSAGCVETAIGTGIAAARALRTRFGL